MNEVTHHIATTEAPITLTDAATRHILLYLEKKPDMRGIRFAVKKTGCSGLSYVIDYIDSEKDSDIILQLFDQYLVCIDKKSYPYLKGSVVDYVKQGLNAQFVFKNPNQTGQCGCGESFTID